MIDELSETKGITSNLKHGGLVIEEQLDGWEESSGDALRSEDYSYVIKIYEKIIESNLASLSDFFHLGLAYLLNGEEDLAQMTWFSAITERSDEDTNVIHELSNILEKEANRQTEEKKLEKAWVIRQHLREINSSNINNHLELILLSIQLEIFSLDLMDEWKTIHSIKLDAKNFQIESKAFELLVDKILDFHSKKSLEVSLALFSISKDQKECANILLRKAHSIKTKSSEFAGEIAKICLTFFPENLILWQTIYTFYSNSKNHKESIEIANSFLNVAKTIGWKVIAIYSLIREKTRGGSWSDIEPIMSEYKRLMHEMTVEGLSENDFTLVSSMSIVPCMLQYYQDNPTENRYLQNQFSTIFQNKILEIFRLNTSEISDENLVKSQTSYLFKKKYPKKESKLKIGFLVSKLKLHSVGWLSRWLFQYYDQSKFDFLIYVINQKPGDSFTELWFESKVTKCSYFNESDFKEVAELIYSDEIDILIDLDSTTSCGACNILALKPAPIQATWLGFDASGVPSVDYFIVDPYLLPENAQNYYSEKIWRLPHTYVAVDGFETDVPTLSRRILDIPEDAVVYLSAQTGQKRNPHTIRLQLRIIKEVAQSYLLIKGWGDSSVIQDLFHQLAHEEGVNLSQLRFLPIDPNEYVHRANLQVADIILDTYPYNGATTTLEALWMGIPIITRVGKQCAARNSYTFMVQVGVTDGIAATDEEYLEWGVRFGREPQLRKKVNTQLRQSRHTSPLWNTKQFTKDMETAFQQMWDIYSQNISIDNSI
jgi:predicted O-linked N-acetylglucosamine transferase (SPINDLY family)